MVETPVSLVGSLATYTVHARLDPADYPDPRTSLIACAALQLPAAYYRTVVQAGVAVQELTPAGGEILRRLGDLEAFNGARFINFTATRTVGTSSGLSSGGSGGAMAQTSGYDTRWVINVAQQQIDSINAAYDALSQSIYPALVLQTRLHTYLDSIQLVIDAQGVRFDAAPMAVAFEAKRAVDPRNALIDLIELNRYASSTLRAVSYDGMAQLSLSVEGLAANSRYAQTLPHWVS